MSKVEAKGCPNYKKFDLLDTSVLEAILRADFDAPEAEQIDAEEALYIANLIAERRNVEHKDVETSLNEFFEYYYPMAQKEEGLYTFDDETDKEVSNNIPQENSQGKVLSFVKKSWRIFSSAVAVLVLFLSIGTATAYALGYNPLGVIGRWNDDQFWFEPVTVTTELADVVADYAGGLQLVPEWLPEGYVFDKVDLFKDGALNSICADFVREKNNSIDELYIDYMFPINDNNTPLYEKDTSEVTEYEMYGTKYYIMDNLGIRAIVWRNEDYAGSIKGHFSLEDAENIINSIYGE